MTSILVRSPFTLDGCEDIDVGSECHFLEGSGGKKKWLKKAVGDVCVISIQGRYIENQIQKFSLFVRFWSFLVAVKEDYVGNRGERIL